MKRDETVKITLSNASNANISDSEAILTITDDEDYNFTAADIATTADGAMDVHLADIDGDGDLDIIAASIHDDTIAWYENDGAAKSYPSWNANIATTSADNARCLCCRYGWRW